MGAHRKRTHETLPYYTAPYVAPQSPTREGGPRWAMLALPREAWKPIPGGCCCRYCSADSRKAGEAFYDAMSFDLDGGLLDGLDVRAGYCHAPELHGAPLKRAEW